MRHLSSMILAAVAVLSCPAIAAAAAPIRSDGAEHPVDEVVSGGPTDEPRRELYGVFIDIPFTATGNVGSLVRGVNAGSFGAGMGLRAGFYPTQHFGFVGGVSFAAGDRFDSGCDSSSCGFVTYSVPVALQISFQNRKEGPYLEVGAALSPTYMLYDPSGTATAKGFADGHFAMGWHFRSRSARADHDISRWGGELFLSADAGKYNQVSASTVDGAGSGAIASDAQAMHATLSFGYSSHFTL